MHVYRHISSSKHRCDNGIVRTMASTRRVHSHKYEWNVFSGVRNPVQSLERFHTFLIKGWPDVRSALEALGFTQERLVLIAHDLLEFGVLLLRKPVWKVPNFVATGPCLPTPSAIFTDQRISQGFEHLSSIWIALVQHFGPKVIRIVQSRNANEHDICPHQERHDHIVHDLEVHESHFLQNNNATRSGSSESVKKRTHM